MSCCGYLLKAGLVHRCTDMLVSEHFPYSSLFTFKLILGISTDSADAKFEGSQYILNASWEENRFNNALKRCNESELTVTEVAKLKGPFFYKCSFINNGLQVCLCIISAHCIPHAHSSNTNMNPFTMILLLFCTFLHFFSFFGLPFCCISSQ